MAGKAVPKYTTFKEKIVILFVLKLRKLNTLVNKLDRTEPQNVMFNRVH